MDKRERILIIDDEATIRKLLRQKLTREGYECREAASAEAAMEMLAEQPADAIILDIRMPGKAGTELLPEVKSEYPETAVIMASAVTDTNLAIECMRKGADDYICKPFNLEEVALSVQRALEKKNLQLQIKQYQNNLEDKVDAQTAEIRRSFLGAIESMVTTLEAKDRYTSGHSQRVAKIAVDIGRELGLTESAIDDLHWGGLLHDVGKIAVDQIIQNKPGRLTREEYEHIMIHAHVGAGIVRPVVNRNVVEMIEHHHDHYDGSGLHQVIAGTEIPLAARILAVADAFDAMTSERAYRPAMTVEEAVDEVKRCTGSQFDPVVVEAFLKRVGMIRKVESG